MDKSNIRTYILRLKETLEELSSELVRAVQYKDSPGKSQSSRIRRNQLISRIKHLTQSIKLVVFKGHILDVTYIQTFPGLPDRKFRAVLTDISQDDFEYFVRQMNDTREGSKIVILEIREIPTFINELPL